MQCIRFEHPDTKVGIWRHFSETDDDLLKYFSDLNSRHSGGKFETPYSEDKLCNIMNSNYRCAYKTMDQVREWITSEEIHRLVIGHGFKIYLIESETEIYEGKFQVIFMPEHIKSKTDITSLFINS